MIAVSYEYLLRRVYHCGRGGVPDADADVYRRMEVAEGNISNPDWIGSADQKFYDFQVAFNRVKSNVQKAISVGMKEVKHKLSSEHEKELLKYLQELRSTRFYNKERFDEIILEAEAIFNENGLVA